MPADLTVPEGTILLLLPGEWVADGLHDTDQANTGPDLLLYVVAVRPASGRWVHVQAHACNHRNPECGNRHHCWEARVLASAIHQAVAGRR